MPELLRSLESTLDGAGLNLRGAIAANDYDAGVPAAWRSAELLPGARSALVVASGGRALWDAFRASPEFGEEPDPLDAYTVRVLADISGTLRAAGQASCALLAFERRGGVYADFVALAKLAGLGAPSRLGLLIHPEYGPWMSIRAVLLTALDWPQPAQAAGFDPCPACPAPCARVCPGEALAGTQFSVSACDATRRREPGCRLLCAARRACPVGSDHTYEEAAEAHHMSRSRSV